MEKKVRITDFNFLMDLQNHNQKNFFKLIF